MSGKRPIEEFFKGRSVLITGATGFLGKVLLEKLLRSCPSIYRVFVLMRPKRNISVQDRLEEMTKLPLFNRIKGENASLLTKIRPVCGDVVNPKLGLNKLDEELIRNTVTVVFHSAASVKFDEPLRQAVAHNLVGTINLINLCGEIRDIQAIVYVSTAYVNCNYFSDIHEKLYPIHIGPKELIDILGNTDDKNLSEITPKILGNFPNTYTLTKALAEHYLSGLQDKFPIAVFRPAIVVCTAKEPFQGWVDSSGGMGGPFIAALKGIMTVSYVNPEMSVDVIPVDICANIMISAAWHVATVRKGLILHGVPLEKKVLWKDIEKSANDVLRTQPVSTDNAGMSPCVIQVSDKIFVRIFWLIKYAPYAIWLDSLKRLLHTQTRYAEQQKKVFDASAALEYFATHEWSFKTENLTALHHLMSLEEKQV